MKKLLFSVSLLISAYAFSQQSSSLILADGIIANENFMKAQKSNIKSVKNYKTGTPLPKTLSAFSEALPSGITALSLKESNFDRIALADLNVEHHLDAKNPVMVDRRLFKDTDLKVAGDLLVSMEVIMMNGKEILSISSEGK